MIVHRAALFFLSYSPRVRLEVYAVLGGSPPVGCPIYCRGHLVGSCKWTNAPMGLDDAARLRKAVSDRASELTPAERPWWALFSREGSSSALVEMAKHDENHLLLYGPDDLFFQEVAPTE